jgi:hypothetical protein
MSGEVAESGTASSIERDPRMGLNLPAANSGAGAPEVEDGLAVLRFDDLVQVAHPDWAGTDNYGKPDDGSRYHFKATLMQASEETKGAYVPAYDDEGDSIDLEMMTRTATGKKSNFRAGLEGVLTPQEFALWEANTPFDGDDIKGRLLNGKIAHNKNGWPYIEQFLGPVKVSKAAK